AITNYELRITNYELKGASMTAPLSPDFAAFDRYVEEHFNSFVEELRHFCSQPTLALQGIGLEDGVKLVQGALEPLGARTEVVPLDGGAPPVVLAELGSGNKTLLFYNHYDVQPPEPLEM